MNIPTDEFTYRILQDTKFNLWDFDETQYIFLDYFAVASNARGYQFGTRFLRFIINDFLVDGRFLVVEVEHPDYGVNRRKETGE